MIKKIIALVICLALCVTGLTVGFINQQAKNGGEMLEAGANAIIGVGENVSVDNVSTTPGLSDANKVGAPETVGTVTTKVDTSSFEATGDDGIVKDGNTYYLTGNITVDEAADIDALAAVIGDDERTDSVVFDGNGYTITTSISLFGMAKDFTFRNVTVAGAITRTDAGTLTAKYYYMGIIADSAYGTVAFDNVNVTASMTLDKNTRIIGYAGFVGTIQNGQTTLTIKDCAFSGTLLQTSTVAAGTQVRAGGFIGRATDNSSVVTIEGCTVTGTVMGNYHVGGFISNTAASTVAIKDSEFKGTVKAKDGNTAASLLGGFIGENSGNVVAATKITNCESSGTVSQNASKGNSTGAGFVGNNGGALEIRNSKVGGSLIFDCSDASTGYNGVGGVIGILSAGADLIALDISPTMEAKSKTTNATKGVGGVVGALGKNGVATLTNCKIQNNITADATAVDLPIGGVVGKVYSGPAELLINGGTSVGGTVTNNAVTVVGGVIGAVNGEVAVTITGDSTIANTINNNGGDAVGGVIGFVMGNTATITVTEDSDILGTINFNVGGKGAVLAPNAGNLNGCGGVVGAIGLVTSKTNLTSGIVTLKGNGVISPDINMNQPSQYVTGVGGVVGHLAVGTLNVEGANIKANIDATNSTAANGCGGIVGFSPAGNVNITADHTGRRTTLDGTIIGKGDTAGGIIGRIRFGNSRTVDYIKVDGMNILPTFNLTGNNVTGGLVGYFQDASITEMTFKNIDFAGTIECTNSGAQPMGLLTQFNAGVGAVTFENVNLGTVNAETGAISGQLIPSAAGSGNFGGFIGQISNKGVPTVTFENCVNYLDISSTTANANVGGFVGLFFRSQAVTFENCKNFGDISGANAGGIVGKAVITDGNGGSTGAKNCVNLGNVNGTIAGGIFGDNSLSGTIPNVTTVENCINLGQISGTTIGDIVAKVGDTTTVKNCVNLVAGDVYAIDANGAKVTDVFTASEGTASDVNVAFNAAVNKTFYDVIESAVGDANVTFNAIVTFKAYGDVIGGDFTHQVYTDYLKEHSSIGVSKLYMNAEFKDDRTTQNIDPTVETVVGTDYSVPVILERAEATYDASLYVARAYVKLNICGTIVYVYSAYGTNPVSVVK